jgi:hypothetical protein
LFEPSDLKRPDIKNAEALMWLDEDDRNVVLGRASKSFAAGGSRAPAAMQPSL